MITCMQHAPHSLDNHSHRSQVATLVQSDTLCANVDNVVMIKITLVDTSNHKPCASPQKKFHRMFQLGRSDESSLLPPPPPEFTLGQKKHVLEQDLI